jgi:hypothetical protein
MGTTCPGLTAKQVSKESTDGPHTFRVEYKAAPSTSPGKCDLTFKYNFSGGPADVAFADAVTVYDATPQILSVVQDPPVDPGGPFYIQIYGTNFGLGPGSVTVCTSATGPCNQTPDITVCLNSSCGAVFGYWDAQNGNQVNALLTPAPSASGLYYVQITSGGAVPASGFAPAPQGQSDSKSNRGGPVQLAVTSVSLSPGNVSLSTGDTNKSITTTVSPSNVPFSVIYSASTAPFVQPPGSPCTPSLAFTNVNGVGSVNSTVTASPPNCGGLFSVRATVGSMQSSNIATVTVPPQALIRQMVGAAGGFPLSVDPGQVAQRSVGIAAKNRFTLPGFNGWTTWQQFQDGGVIEGKNDPTANGPPVVIDNAVAVYSGAVTADFVGGAPCYWSPQYSDEWVPLMNQYQANPSSTTFPSGSPIHLRLPTCYGPASGGPNQQVIWKASEPANIRTDAGGVYLNAPAFLFVKQRNPDEPAIVQIP